MTDYETFQREWDGGNETEWNLMQENGDSVGVIQKRKKYTYLEVHVMIGSSTGFKMSLARLEQTQKGVQIIKAKTGNTL